MMLVTARMLGTGSSPQCSDQFLAASLTGSNGSGSGIVSRVAWHTRSEHWGLRVGAPHLLQRFDHLALGRVRPRALDQRGHQVGLGGRGLAQRGEPALDLGPVAARADSLYAADLLALERGVDAQDRQLAGRAPPVRG